MKKIYVNRIFQNRNKTLSQCVVADGHKFVLNFKAIELPWRDNQRFISCIPPGDYPAKAIKRASRPNEYGIWLPDVPSRSGIMIHVGNFVRQLNGCIAPGTKFIDIDRDGIIDVTNSRYVMEQLQRHIPLGASTRVIVTNVFQFLGNQNTYAIDTGEQIKKYKGDAKA